METAKTEDILFLIFLVLVFELIFINCGAFKFVLKPAYISTQIICNEDFKTDWTIVGMFMPNNSQIEINPNIDVNSLLYKKTLIHEKTHLKQYQEKRLWDCYGVFNLFFFKNEIEAYASELFVR